MSEKQRGLGRGLSALLGEANPVAVAERPAEAAPQGTQTQPIDLLVRNPDQPRRVFNDADIDDLSASIREKGVLQPLLVRPAPGQAGRYQIIAGERRWRAAQKAGLHEVPVIIRQMDDLEVLEVGIIENIQRADLNAIEEARGYRVLMERFGRTQDALAQSVGKSRPHIANSLRLLVLPETVQDHVLQGRLSAGHARTLVTAANAAALADEIIAKGLSVRQAEVLVRDAGKTGGRAPEIKGRAEATPDVKALETRLREALGFVVKVDDKSGKGDVRIAYSSLEQLDEICRKLLN